VAKDIAGKARSTQQSRSRVAGNSSSAYVNACWYNKYLEQGWRLDRVLGKNSNLLARERIGVAFKISIKSRWITE
jgi:hypothetical protein